MAAYYWGRKGKYKLLDMISSGGEGAVYNVKGSPEYVAKIYNESKFQPTGYISDPRTYMTEKLETMLEQPIPPYMSLKDGGSVLAVAFPIDILKDDTGKLAGFIMPRVHSDRIITAATTPYTRASIWPHWNSTTAARISYNLVQTARYIHSYGYIIGDLNPKNIMVDPQKGCITFIDVDSFTVTNNRTGVTYKTTVDVKHMLPPELQGKGQNDIDFTLASDYFGIAIHIFQIYMNGAHPFGYQQSGTPANDCEIYNITHGIYPYTQGSSLERSPFVPDPMTLPLGIRNLFDRTFCYTEAAAASSISIQRRANDQDWINVLTPLVLTSTQAPPRSSATAGKRNTGRSSSGSRSVYPAVSFSAAAAGSRKKVHNTKKPTNRAGKRDRIMLAIVTAVFIIALIGSLIGSFTANAASSVGQAGFYTLSGINTLYSHDLPADPESTTQPSAF